MIGFANSGRAGSGKSTLARIVVGELTARGQLAEKMSFADEIKREVYELYGILKTDVGGREALIRHGEERRKADPTYWIDKLQPRVRGALAEGIVPVIDDLRFTEELDWLRKIMFYTVRVNSPRHLRIKRLEAQGMDGAFVDSEEESETQLTSRGHDLSVLNLRDGQLATVGETLACGYMASRRGYEVRRRPSA